MMTGDGKCIGSKDGICFNGKWVWGLKDYIDMSFMNLFNPLYLFKDYKTQGTKEPLKEFKWFEDVSDEEKVEIEKIKENVKSMEPHEASMALQCDPEEKGFQDKWQIILRMKEDLDFKEKVVSHYSEKMALIQKAHT